MAGGQPVETTHMWTPKGEHKVVNSSDVEKFQGPKFKWTTEKPVTKVDSGKKE